MRIFPAVTFACGLAFVDEGANLTAQLELCII